MSGQAEHVIAQKVIHAAAVRAYSQPSIIGRGQNQRTQARPIPKHSRTPNPKLLSHKFSQWRKAELLFSSRMHCMLNSVQACLTQCEN